MNDQNNNIVHDTYKIMYLRDKRGHRRGVIALRQIGDSILAAASLQHKNEPWNKERGILKATCRLRSESVVVVATAGKQVDTLANVLRSIGSPANVEKEGNTLRFDNTIQWMLARPPRQKEMAFDGETAGIE